MTHSLQHRGPDADGHWVDDESGMALGHRRLSIVDLSPTGAQPMRSPSGRFVIVFNGEIYNYRRLREELGAVDWRGSSDTEVMLAAFERWGIANTLPRLAGMFAFAVWDTATRELWLARDRMGEKPLYIAQFDGLFAFASELKAIRTLPSFPHAINASAIAQVLQQGYVGGTHSAYQAVSRLRPGEYAVVTERDGTFSTQVEHYWSVESELQKESRSYASDNAATDALDALLTGVVGDEMVADVPVGAFLSGGIDSSLIVALMQKVASRPVRTFTIGFRENSHDESPFAREVARHLGTEHTEIILSADDALAFVERLPAIFDEPFADSSQLPTLLVSSVTRKHVTVALSGDGGDELFGGYSHHAAGDPVRSLLGRVPKALRPTFGAAIAFAPKSVAQLALARGTAWAPNTRNRLIHEARHGSRALAYENSLAKWVNPADVLSANMAALVDDRVPSAWPSATSDEESRMAYDMGHYMPDDILVKVDRSAMACSLETRAPLLDHRVVEFALHSPLHQKIRDGRGKFLLRNLLSRYVPQHMIDRPKQGFAIPLSDWLRGPLRSWGEAMLEPDALLKNWLQPAVVAGMWQQHQRGVNHAERLWPVLMIMQWLRAMPTAA